MSRDVTAIYNLALSSVGNKAKVSIPTERSREAELCTLWYEIARDVVLRAAYWPSTGAFKRLPLLATKDDTTDWTTDDPSPDWKYAYGLPSDMVRPRYITAYSRFRLDWYRPSGSDPVQALMTNLYQPILYYTFRQENPANWDPMLYEAVAASLAAHIAMDLTAKRSRMVDAENKANNLIRAAQAAVANSEEDSYDTTPEWIQARGYSDSATVTKYFFPYGPALSISAQVSGGKANIFSVA